MERIPSDKLEQWLHELEAPLPGTEKQQPTEGQIEREGSDFMAAMMQHQQLTGG